MSSTAQQIYINRSVMRSGCGTFTTGRGARAEPTLDLSSSAAIEDWHAMLDAVKARLRLTVSLARAETPATPESPTHGATHAKPGRTRANVLDCVAALDQLHTQVEHELGRRQDLEMQLLDSKAALALSRVELIGTQASERDARHLSLHDSLTLLPNRRLFRQRLDHALANSTPDGPALAVFYLDLDDFKSINDTHGHDVGDELLRIVAARLIRALRCEDTVSRLGGDEFACLLSNLPSRDQLEQLACKLFGAVCAPVTIGDLKLTVCPSIGIAMCPADGSSAEELLKNADAAMYRAKRQRTGYGFFESR
jgi:diguanylate cyclase (GGDEF)-like protein